MKRTLFFIALVVSASAVAQGPTTCVMSVTDPAGQASVATLTSTLETALAQSFTVVPSKTVARVARRLGLARSDWGSTPGLTRLARALKCTTPLNVQLVSTFGTWTLTLTVLDPETGAERASVRGILSKPKISAERARDAVANLEATLAGAAPATPLRASAEVKPPVEKGEEKAGTGATTSGTTAGAANITPAEKDEWALATEGFEAPAAGTAAAGAPSTLESIRLDTTLEYGGRVVFEHYSFFENGTAAQLAGRDNVEAALRLKAVHPRATAFASVLARADFADPSRNRFDPEEAWVELNFPYFSVKAGRLLVSWGTANLYNPTDVLNYIDFRDPLDTEKFGTLMFRASGTLGPVTLEAYYLPVPEAHLLPTITSVLPNGTLVSRSRWVRGDVDLAGTIPLNFHIGTFTPPPPRLSNSQFAGRAELSAFGADFGLGYAYIVDHIPSPLVEAVPEPGIPLGADVYIDWAYRRLHVITLDAERTFGKLRTALEGAVFLTADLPSKNPRVADPYFIINVGADYQTGEFAGSQRLHFFLEFVLSRAIGGKLETDGIDQLRYPFPLNLLGRIAWEINSDVRVEVNAITALDKLDLFIAPRFEYQFFDRIKAKVGVDILAGNAKGYFGAYRTNSRLIATVEARF